MKAFIIGLIFVAVLGVGGFFGLQYLSKQAQTTDTSNSSSVSVTLTGLLVPGKGDDYSYIVVTKEKTIGVTSQTIQLESYANKNVEITGSYSGTTLYAHAITEKK